MPEHSELLLLLLLLLFLLFLFLFLSLLLLLLSPATVWVSTCVQPASSATSDLEAAVCVFSCPAG